jgi:hypothetical protein
MLSSTAEELLQEFKRYERVVCKNGATVSVQAGLWLYSTPRASNVAYTHVEAGFPDGKIPMSWIPYAENLSEGFHGTVYPYIPFELIDEYILLNGGMVSGELPSRAHA